MEMLQRRAHQRRCHVFSTAGRSEVLPANSVPEDPQRSAPVCARLLLHVCVCTRVCLFFFSCICISAAAYVMMESTAVKCCVHSHPCWGQSDSFVHSSSSHLVPSSLCSICSSQNVPLLLSRSQLTFHLRLHVKQQGSALSSAVLHVQRSSKEGNSSYGNSYVPTISIHIKFPWTIIFACFTFNLIKNPTSNEPPCLLSTHMKLALHLWQQHCEPLVHIEFLLETSLNKLYS